MRNLKSVLAVVAVSVFTLFSCSEDNTVEMQSANAGGTKKYAKSGNVNYNTKTNQAALVALAENLDSVQATMIQLSTIGVDRLVSEGVDATDVQAVIDYYEKCSDCHEGIKPVMVPMLREISKANDGDIVKILDTYERNITSYGMSYEDEQNTQLIIGGIRAGIANTILDGSGGYTVTPNGFWDCMRQRGGRAMGEGLAYGMVTGCVGGAYAGMTAGTFTVPGLGTAVGGVGGCIFGGASGAVVGAVGGLLWAANSCK